MQVFSCNEACLCHSVNWTWADRDVYKKERHERCNVTVVNELKRKVPNENWIEIKWTTEQHPYTASKTLYNWFTRLIQLSISVQKVPCRLTNKRTNIFVIFILTCYKSIHFFYSMHCNYLEKRKTKRKTMVKCGYIETISILFPNVYLLAQMYFKRIAVFPFEHWCSLFPIVKPN